MLHDLVRLDAVGGCVRILAVVLGAAAHGCGIELTDETDGGPQRVLYRVDLAGDPLGERIAP